ncbi:Hypp1204 [Branchiostoma lanceolatum]|uniref:Hypp1204 protein n=1 Tax=Branchiostoma lanceolatum TaxID=7740 RepID=A0A8J9ZFN1_BRALA|nr:Hypp1204 [Branchiostoma lanceolatum]
MEETLAAPAPRSARWRDAPVPAAADAGRWGPHPRLPQLSLNAAPRIMGPGLMGEDSQGWDETLCASDRMWT